MRFRVTDVYDYYRPSECRLRASLRHRRVEEEPPGPFQETLRGLGQAHERRELATLADVVDLSTCDPEARERRTLESIHAGASCIYQGRLTARLDLDGEECEIVGEPDFLIRTGEGYLIRDSKLARTIDDDRHPEIFLQLQLYGWLFEQNVGVAAAGLQVHAGDDRLVPIPDDHGASAMERLRFLRQARLEEAGFYEPVGWSKCAGCGYRKRCWTRAESANDIALLPAVSQRWARRLHGRGVTDIRTLGKAFARADLRDLFFEKATKKKPERLKPGAASIQQSVQAREAGVAVTVGVIEVPDPSSAIMLDFEGLPPYSNEVEKVYLWGFKDFRGEPARYLAAQSGLGLDGDREGWEAFLRIAAGLLSERPDSWFVHYGNYERVKIDLYRRRYEDPSGTAEILLKRLFDLHRATSEAVVLPVDSYSLKVVERFVGFTRKVAQANGEWAMARYIEATESGSAERRAGVLAEVRAYNEEDLDATRAVLQWLQRRQETDTQGDVSQA